MVPRKNGQKIDSSWFTELQDAIAESELEYDLLASEAATPLDGQEFDGTEVSSVKFEFEVIRGSTVFANGVAWMQYKAGTWKFVFPGGWEDEDGTDPKLIFTIDQVTTIGTLEVETVTGPGTGTLKIKRRTFSA